MATRNSTLKNRTNKSAAIPAGNSEPIRDRLDKQRGRIYQVASVVHALTMAIHGKIDRVEGEDKDLESLWSVLNSIDETLNDIAEQIDLPVVFKEEVAHV
jgi:hypothetical protein